MATGKGGFKRGFLLSNNKPKRGKNKRATTNVKVQTSQKRDASSQERAPKTSSVLLDWEGDNSDDQNDSRDDNKSPSITLLAPSSSPFLIETTTPTAKRTTAASEETSPRRSLIQEVSSSSRNIDEVDGKDATVTEAINHNCNPLICVVESDSRETRQSSSTHTSIPSTTATSVNDWETQRVDDHCRASATIAAATNDAIVPLLESIGEAKGRDSDEDKIKNKHPTNDDEAFGARSRHRSIVSDRPTSSTAKADNRNDNPVLSIRNHQSQPLERTDDAPDNHPTSSPLSSSLPARTNYRVVSQELSRTLWKLKRARNNNSSKDKKEETQRREPLAQLCHEFIHQSLDTLEAERFVWDTLLPRFTQTRSNDPDDDDEYWVLACEILRIKGVSGLACFVQHNNNSRNPSNSDKRHRVLALGASIIIQRVLMGNDVGGDDNQNSLVGVLPDDDLLIKIFPLLVTMVVESSSSSTGKRSILADQCMKSAFAILSVAVNEPNHTATNDDNDDNDKKENAWAQNEALWTRMPEVLSLLDIRRGWVRDKQSSRQKSGQNAKEGVITDWQRIVRDLQRQQQQDTQDNTSQHRLDCTIALSRHFQGAHYDEKHKIHVGSLWHTMIANKKHKLSFPDWIRNLKLAQDALHEIRQRDTAVHDEMHQALLSIQLRALLRGCLHSACHLSTKTESLESKNYHQEAEAICLSLLRSPQECTDLVVALLYVAFSVFLGIGPLLTLFVPSGVSLQKLLVVATRQHCWRSCRFRWYRRN